MARERDLDKIFDDYDAFLASMGLGGNRDNMKPKPSVFGKKSVEINQLAKELDNGSFKREHLQAYRKTILAMYASNTPLMIQNGFDEVEIAELKTNYNKIAKLDYCHIVSKLFRNKEIYQFFLATLESDVKKVFDTMVWQETLSDDEILKETGVEIFIQTEKKTYNNKSFFEKDFKKDFTIFCYETQSEYNYLSNSYNKNFFIEIPIELRKVLKEYYEKPLYYDFIPLKETPKTDFIAYSETEIFTIFPHLVNLNQQGSIKTSSSGKVISTSLSKIRKTLNINELYPDTASKELQFLKTYLLASLVVSQDKPKKNETFLGLLKSYIDTTYIKKYHSHTHLLTHLKGGHNLFQVQDVESTFLEVLKLLPINEWISTQNILDFISLRSFDFKISTIAQMCQYFTYETENRYGKDKNHISKTNYKSFTTEPFIKGSLMLWACYGLLDIAYNYIDTSELGTTYYSNYDGIKAVRLTNLGAYLLEKTAQYETPKIEKSYELAFSTESLMILVEGETNITDGLLVNYADKIGSNRYAVSNESFLNNVTNKKDLKMKIDIFKQVVSNKLPPNWLSFFENLDRKVHPLKQVEEVMVFKVPNDDPELIKLLTQNQVIKKMLYKAEDFQIIVLKKDYPSLRNKLKTYGYLLN
ncbi:hypothetical protein [Emticicia sp. SJ17W-69]|uniref:hypothetical protein n=1 Tax=Emticicia sp. SJ17W-69 TaxID=3421657 RepID=UPI003EBB975E